MSFLDEFDRRAKSAASVDKNLTQVDTPSKVDEPSQLAKEEQELLEFADLIRLREALPPQIVEREQTLQRVRQAEFKKSKARLIRSNRFWDIFTTAAAMLALVAMIFLLSPRRRAQETQVARTDYSLPVTDYSLPVIKNPAQLPEALGDSFKPIRYDDNKILNAEFADIDFPEIKVIESQGASAESSNDKEQARLLRVRGLAMYQPQGVKKWRVGARGAALAVGDTIRTSKRLQSSARILAPDGTAISIGDDTVLRYDGLRKWSLVNGRARFEVAHRPDLENLVVTTPQGTLKAIGTEFTVSADPAKAATICWVEQGKVSVAATEIGDSKTTGGRDARVPTVSVAATEIGAGKGAVIREKSLKITDEKLSSAWLDILNDELEIDHGVGQLIAKADKDGAKLPLEIKSHKVSVTVVDGVARTFVDMLFVNHSDRRLEGTFYYPLPSDATISEFAMYVGDQRIIGEVLEQQRARQVFEYIVRQQKDPALLEFAGGNLFKMRVYPIEPRSDKRVQLGYTQILPRHQGQTIYTYPLYSEMLLKNPLRDLTIEFRALSSAGLTNLQSPSHNLSPALSADGKKGVIAFHAKNYSPSKDFSVTYQIPNAPELVTLTHQRQDTDDPDTYLMLQLDPRLELPRRDPPENLLVIVDGCSGNPQDYATACEFAAATADLSANWSLSVMRANGAAFNDGKFVAPSTSAAQEMRDFLAAQTTLGATDMLATFKAALEHIPPRERVHLVYLGDGIDTASELSGPALVKAIISLMSNKDIRVSTVAVGSNYDAPTLKSIAAGLGGTFTRVQGAAEIFNAADQVMESFYRPMLEDVCVTFKDIETRQLYPDYLGALFVGDTAVMLGRIIKGKKGSLCVKGLANGAPFERDYPLDLTPNLEHNRFLPRLWAKARIDSLLSLLGLSGASYDAKLRQQIIETSVTYQIMSPFTAFLVLESEEDYARYGIKRNLKQMDWKGEQDGQMDATQRDVNVSNFDVFHGLLRSEKPLSSDPLSSDPSDIVVPPDILRQAELGDHWETINPDRPDTHSMFANPDSGFLDRAKDNDEPEGGGGMGGSSLDDLIGVGGIARDSDSGGGGWGGGYGTGISVNGRFIISEPSSIDYKKQRQCLIRAKELPHYRSLIFPAGKLVDLEVDGTLRSVLEYRRIISAGKGTLSTQLNLSLALEAQGQFMEALKALKLVIEKYPGLTELRLQEGVLNRRVGDAVNAKAVFDKALELTSEKDRANMRSRIAQILSNLGAYEDAARMQESDVSQATTATEAASITATVAQRFDAAGKHELARQLWTESLRRWQTDAKILSAAAVWHLQYNQDIPRGLELLKAARQAGAPAQIQAIESLSRHKKKDEALAECRYAFDTAKTANEIYSALSAIASHEQQSVNAEALRLITEEKNATQLEGSLQYLQCSNTPLLKSDAEKIFSVFRRAETKGWATALMRFYTLTIVGSKNLSAETDSLVADFAAPQNVAPVAQASVAQASLPASVVDEFNLAIRIPSLLATWKNSDSAMQFIQTLRDRKNLTDQQKQQLLQTEWSLLQQQNKYVEAEKVMAQAFEKATDQNFAEQAVNALFYLYIQRQESEKAAKLLTDLAARFPQSKQFPYMLNNLIANVKNDVNSYQKILDILDTKTMSGCSDILILRAKSLMEKNKLREAAQILREIIEHQSRDQSRNQSRDREGAGSESAPSPSKDDVKKEEGAQAKDLMKTKTAQQRQLLNRLIAMLAKVSSQDAEQRAAFLKEANEKVKFEDPGAREWTEAILTCLDAAGDVKALVRKLEELSAAEPQDPQWNLRLANAYIHNKRFLDARRLLERLFDADPANADSFYHLAQICAQFDKADVEKRFARHLDAIAKDQALLEQCADCWHSLKPEWSLKAWQRSFENAPSDRAAFRIAQILEIHLKREAEALPHYLRALALNAQGNYFNSIIQRLEQLAQQEEHYRWLNTATREALTQKPEGVYAVGLNLLLFRLEKLKSHSDAAIAALETATTIALPACFAVVEKVLNTLVDEKLFLQDEAYARKGGGDTLSADQRRQMLNLLADRLNANMLEQQRAIAIYRELAQGADNCASNAIQQLTQLLINVGKLDEIEQLLRGVKENAYNAYYLYNAWENLINAYLNRNQEKTAIRLAMVARDYFKNDYAGNVRDIIFNICSHVVNNNKTVEPETHALLTKEILERARAHFASNSSNDYFNEYPFLRAGQFDLRNELNALAREAGQSNEVQRVINAAQYFSNRGAYAEAQQLYRRALNMDGADQDQIWHQLYNLYAYRNQPPQWKEAFEALEALRFHKRYGEFWLLHERGRCLYGLNRKDEAREAWRKLISLPDYHNQYWQYSNLANEAQQFDDWEMATELWEKAIQARRARAPKNQNLDEVASFYGACATAYAKLNKDEQALDCYMRALSLIPRDNHQHQKILRQALTHLLAGKKLDDVVATYEKKLADDNVQNRGGDKPYLRVAFAEGYKRSGDTRKQLAQLQIAANLMPKDMKLRQKVIAGFRQLKDQDAVLRAYADWAKYDSQNIEVYRDWGNFYQSLGQKDNALRAWASMPQARPREAEGYRAYAERLSALNMHLEAASALRKALRYRPTEHVIANELAKRYEQLNQRDSIPKLWIDGETACRKAIEDFADDPLPWLDLGRFLTSQNRVGEARSMYQKILGRSWPRFQNDTYNEARKLLDALPKGLIAN